MRKPLLLVTVAAIVSLGFGVSHGPAAPALADKPIKYEFGELRYTRTGGGGNFGGGMQAGLPPGLGGPGGAQQAGRGPGEQGMPAITTILRFCTGDDEIESDNWKGLADKLKAPAPKKEVSQTVHKLRVLNKLAADGWEFDNFSDSNVWALRRRLP